MKPDRTLLQKKPPEPAVLKPFPYNPSPLKKGFRRFAAHSPDGRPTIANVFGQLWKQLRHDRKWSVSTASGYEKLLLMKILPVFENLFPGRALMDLYESDIMLAWDRICLENTPSTVKSASTILRTFFDLAAAEHFTLIVLWALPDEEIAPPSAPPIRDSDDSPADKREGASLIHDSQIPKSLSLETVIRLFRILLEHIDSYGEALAALIMLFTGARTSEACGFLMQDFQEVCPGYWTLCRNNVVNSRREIEMGGKTKNAYRLLPVPPQLEKILKQRADHLRNHYQNTAIDQLPIACKGTDYFTPCTGEDLNRFLKSCFKEAGVDAELLEKSSRDLKNQNVKDKKQTQTHATAYLLRRHFATMTEICGIDLIYQQYLMGHAFSDSHKKVFDFSNPELFRLLSDAVRLRPLSQIFDPQTTNDPLLSALVKKSREIWISLQNEPPHERPALKTTTINWDDFFCAQENAAADAEHPAAYDAAALSPQKLSLSVRVKDYGFAGLYPFLTLGNPRTRGQILRYQKSKVFASTLQLHKFQDSENYWLLSEDGLLHPISTKWLLHPRDWSESLHLLRKLPQDTLLIQESAIQQQSSTIVCFSNLGRVGRYHIPNLNHTDEEACSLVSLQPGEKIVSACLCSELDDILLLSAKGKALLLAPSELRPASDADPTLHHGLALTSEDCAALCIPYHSQLEYMIVKRSGLVVRIIKNFPKLSRTSTDEGRQLIYVAQDDSILTAFPASRYLLVVSKNKYLCLDANNIRPLSSVAKGVQTLKLHTGAQLTAAIGLDSI